MKRGVPYAYLVPAIAHGSDSHELAEDLAGVELSAADRRAFGKAVRNGKKALKPLRNPWG